MQLSEQEKEAKKRLCIPLDGLDSLGQIRQRVEELQPVAGMFKIGKEAFTRFGPKSVELVQKYDADIFLDLKYHDIPNTVKGAARVAAELGVAIFNVHASGGSAMMKAAVEGARETAIKNNMSLPKIIAVTVLTSIDEQVLQNELNVGLRLNKHVLELAQMSAAAGLDGIVCSALDIAYMKEALPSDFLYVTPGIKGPNTAAGKDQKRVMTPSAAIGEGAGILVVGRAITSGKTPEARLKAGYEVLRDMAKVI
jgi:orotidine-5'-phosphate decarboxylase